MQFASLQYKKTKQFDLSVDCAKVAIQLYKPLKMQGLLEYSYGIFVFKCVYK